jgi:cysteine desulfuration protein SufE
LKVKFPQRLNNINVDMAIAEIEDEVVAEFELFGDDWEGKYQYLIDLGKQLPTIDKQYKTADRLIKGCQSKVWLHSELKEAKIVFTADSDAIITKGIVALLIRVISGHTAGEIINAKFQFINKIGLMEHLSPNRANGLVSMIKQMNLDAVLLRTQG